MIFEGRLVTIGWAKFEAKRPRADPYSHGYRCQKLNTGAKLRIPHAFEPEARRIFVSQRIIHGQANTKIDPHAGRETHFCKSSK